MKIKPISLICYCCAVLSILLLGTGAASATRAHHRAHPKAHAASCNDGNWVAVPSPGTKLWIRTGPGANYPTAGYYTEGTNFSAGCTGLGWLKLVPGEVFQGDYVNAKFAKSAG